MLRAVRFAARFGFEIEPATAEAIKRLAAHLKSISAERVWMELEMILTDPTRARGWSFLLETGLRGHLAPAWPPPYTLRALRVVALSPSLICEVVCP